MADKLLEALDAEIAYMERTEEALSLDKEELVN